MMYVCMYDVCMMRVMKIVWSGQGEGDGGCPNLELWKISYQEGSARFTLSFSCKYMLIE